MLSFDNGRPIGKIVEGKMKGKLICISNEEQKEEEDPSTEEYGPCCKRCDEDRCIIKPCCKYCCLFENSSSEEGSFEEGSDEKKLQIEVNGKVLPVPNIETRDILFIAGPSGSGKSTLASLYIQAYKKLFPNNKIIIFSRKPTDPVLDKLKPLRFVIDASIISDPVDITEDFRETLVLFDDCNTFQDDKIKKAVSKLMHDILEVGRSFNIYCVITSHLVNPNERKDARVIWNEAHSICIFPRSGNRRGMVYALENYCGLDKKTINQVLALPSRWVIIGKQYPLYVLHEKGALLI